jgi:hypothetical protein
MTIKAKLYLAIALTVLGPVVTIAVALNGMNRLGERFDEVQERAERRAIALELKYAVTDVNGWQTAYGYDGGRSRARFESSADVFRADLREARRELRGGREQRLLDTLATDFDDFMGLDSAAYRELQAGREEGTREILLGPAISRFEEMADTTDRLARYEARRAGATESAFDDFRDDLRRRLVAVATGAAIVIVILLLTASDIARLALANERRRREPAAD